MCGGGGSLSCKVNISVVSSFAIILLRKRELVALLHCLLAVISWLVLLVWVNLF